MITGEFVPGRRSLHIPTHQRLENVSRIRPLDTKGSLATWSFGNASGATRQLGGRRVSSGLRCWCLLVPAEDIVSSQAFLLSWPDAPVSLKITPEIDLCPANNRQWEADHPGFEASEEISALFAGMSSFHDRFGFDLDGVDEHTARLPPDWMDRAATAGIHVFGRAAMIICPSIEDGAVSKLHAEDMFFRKPAALHVRLLR